MKALRRACIEMDFAQFPSVRIHVLLSRVLLIKAANRLTRSRFAPLVTPPPAQSVYQTPRCLTCRVGTKVSFLVIQSALPPPPSMEILMCKAKVRTILVALAALGAVPATAQASDGCTVLLCLAGNWRDIPQCVPPVKKAFRDLARGRGWPSCSMAGAGNSARASRPQCPPQYLIPYEAGDSGEVHYTCRFAGAVESRIKGQPWSRTWWNKSGDTVTEWFSLGRSQMEAASTPIDDQFDRDYADWVKAEEDKAKAEAAADSSSGGA